MNESGLNPKGEDNMNMEKEIKEHIVYFAINYLANYLAIERNSQWPFYIKRNFLNALEDLGVNLDICDKCKIVGMIDDIFIENKIQEGKN